MRRFGSVLLAATGLLTAALYAALAFATYRALLLLWAQRPDPFATALVVCGFASALGYASYRLGTARVRLALDPVELTRGDVPRLYASVDDLAARVGVETPRLLVASMDGPNALALGGPRDGDVVIDGSLFRLLTAAELEAIIAHELTHLKRRDSLVKTLAYSLVRIVTGFVWIALLPVALLAGGIARAAAALRRDDPAAVRRAIRRTDALVTGVAVVLLIALTAVVQAYSRRREFAADDRAARLTGPLIMANALAKIHRASTPGGLLSTLVVDGSERGPVTDLLASHPPMDDRIERLRRRAADRSR